MSTLFYILLISLFVNALSNMSKSKTAYWNVQSRSDDFKQHNNLEDGSDKKESFKQVFKVHGGYICWIIFSLVLVLVGLLTSQWYLFLAVLTLSLFRLSKTYTGYKFSNFIYACIYGFAIINHFHLHIDVLDLLIK